VFFLHGTTWASKHWPEDSWRKLAQLATARGFEVVLSYGNDIEAQRAHRIATGLPDATVLPPGDLSELACVMQACVGVVAVDTGLGHLAAALDVPLVGIYGPTDPVLTGPRGLATDLIVATNLDCIPCLKRECQYKKEDDSGRIHPPCFESAKPELVLEKLSTLIATGKTA